MKKLIYLVAVAVFAFSCQENDAVKEDNTFTGTQSVYALTPASSYPINGTVTFKEKTDGTAVVKVELSGTEGEIQHPVHLHLGNITTTGADVTALLNPVLGKTGVSETSLTTLADESSVTYAQLIALTACIKVHLSDSGPEKDIVLAAGNIGAAAIDGPSGGRLSVGVCKSE